MLNFFKTMHLELAFLQSWIKKTFYPLHTDLDVDELKERATNCGNCRISFRDNSMKHLHHNHLKEKFNFNSVLCPSCNHHALKNENATIFVQNLKSFESRFYAQSTCNPQVREMLEEFKLFTRGSGDQVNSLKIVFKCMRATVLC